MELIENENWLKVKSDGNKKEFFSYLIGAFSDIDLMFDGFCGIIFND